MGLVIGSGPWTLDELRAALRESEPELVTCREASERWGRVPNTWYRWARAGKIPGAFQETDGGTWILPVTGCLRRLEYLRTPKRERIGRGRKPRR